VTLDELEHRIIELKKRGLNILVENELIAELRSQYYDTFIEKKLDSITNQVRNNVRFLGSLHKEFISSNKIKEFMGIQVDGNLGKILYGEYTLHSLKTAIIIAEFYGVPVEILLFQDLEANAETFKQLYPALFRQSRN
jgi:hypothetical protein